MKSLVVVFLMSLSLASYAKSVKVKLDIVSYDITKQSFMDKDGLPRLYVSCATFGGCQWLSYINSDGKNLGYIYPISNPMTYSSDHYDSSLLLMLARNAEAASAECPLTIKLKISDKNGSIKYEGSRLAACAQQ